MANLGRGLLALLLGALLMVAGYLGYYLSGDRYVRERTVTLSAAQLQLVDGQGELHGDDWQLNGALLVSPPLQVSATTYNRLRWSLGLTAETPLALIWVRQAEPDKLYEVQLAHQGLPEGTLSLAGVAGWEGGLLHVGLKTSGALTVRQLVLLPVEPDIGSLLAALWSDWAAFEGWQAYSINFIVGGPFRAVLPPLPAAAIWLVLSLGAYGVLRRIRRWPWTPSVPLLLFLAVWLVLDSRWQVNLLRQLQLTYTTFAGKTLDEKRRADEDGALYAFIAAVKDKLPATPARIFVVNADPGGTTFYTRGRAHYHLLPHNVYSGEKYPPQRGQAKQGDYVLILRPIDNIGYDPQRRVLYWGKDGLLAAEMLYNNELGALLRVL